MFYPQGFKCYSLALWLAWFLTLLAAPAAHAGIGFQPVSPDELHMTSEPLAPGAPAINLYLQVDRNDYGRTSHGGASLERVLASRYEDHYVRIKILTDAGRKYADVEIPVSSDVGSVNTIRARTIHPDGSTIDFDGKVFDKMIVKSKGWKYPAKTFTLPDVQVGSIIEYYYTINFREGWIYNSQWILSDALFTKRARFTLIPFQSDYSPLSFRWAEHLPPGAASPKQGADNIVRLEVTNVAAFQSEDFMPPENELKARVDFIYSAEPFEMDVNKFWRKVGKKRFDEEEKFVGRRGPMEQALPQIVSAGDPPEVKLQKIYARVQQLRNLSYEPSRSDEERKRNNESPANNVEDVWRQGAAWDWQLNWLFLSLARAAGLEAYGVLAPNRHDSFFKAESMDAGRLDAKVVLVKLNGKDVFFEPGAAFAPFGFLRWEESGVQALRLDKDGGTWVQTTLPESSASRIERKAALKLSENGDLGGTLTVSYTGLEALRRRVEERGQDDPARKKYLEEQVQAYIPAAADIQLSKQPDWSNPEVPVVAEFNVKIPGWASLTGRRALLPTGLFGASEKQLFEHAERIHPIYFEYGSQKLDDVSIDLPQGWQVASLPKARDYDLHVVAYSNSVEDQKTALRLKRKLDVNIVLAEAKYYPSLQSFFRAVRTVDEQQIVLQPAAPVSGK